MGAAFYAGVPLFAPALTDEESPEAIGTLCIVDDKPRVSFSYVPLSAMTLADVLQL